MKVTGNIFIFTFMIYLEGISTFKISYKNKLQQIPARSANNRILNGKAIGYGEYAYFADIFYPYYRNDDTSGPPSELWCRGVLISPKWVVTVAHCFDEVIMSMNERKNSTNLVWQTEKVTTPEQTVEHAWVAFALNETEGSGHYVAIDKIYIPDLYDIRYEYVDAVDIAVVSLQEPVPSNIASPPRRIDDDLLSDGSEKHPPTQDCWTVGAGQTSQDDLGTYVERALHKMKVNVGNYRYCTTLEDKLNPGEEIRPKFNKEYVCAESDDSVNPGGRACLGDDGAALVCGDRLLGLLSKRYETGNCEPKNAYAMYVYVGHGRVYNWLRGIISGTIVTELYKSVGSYASRRTSSVGSYAPNARSASGKAKASKDVNGTIATKLYKRAGSITPNARSASGLVEASKAWTWFLTVVSVAISLNTYN